MLSRYVPYFFSCLFLLYETVLQISFACYANELQVALNLSKQALALLSASYFISYAGLQVVMANFVNRTSFRRVFLGSCFALATGTYLFSISTHVLAATLARFLMGASSCAAFILVVNATTKAFKKQYLTLFIGLCQLTSASFVVLFQTRIAALSKIYGYSQVLAYLSFVGFVFFSILYVCLKKQNISGTSNNYSFINEIKALLANRKVYQICFYSFCLWGPVVGLSALWGPVFLQQKMQSTYEQTVFISSLIFFGLAISSPIIGLFSINEKYRQKLVYLCPLFGFFAALIFVLYPNFTYAQACILMLLMGACSAGYEVSYALIREYFCEARCNLVTALNNMAAIFGVAFFQLLVALVLKLSDQNIQFAALVVVCFYASAFFLAYYTLQSMSFAEVNEVV